MKEREPFSLLLRGSNAIYPIFLRGGENKLVAVLRAFCDETNRARSPFTAIGGYVFDESGEHTFTRRWDAILRPLRPRGIRWFHASPCFAGEDEFAALNEAERLAMFGDLVQLVRATAKFGFVASIDDNTFYQMIRRNKVQKYTGTKYTACTLRSLMMLGDWAEKNDYNGGIVYLFESGGPSWDEADHMMKQIRDNEELRRRFRYEDHGFFPKESLMPLQAADMVAWLWQRATYENKFHPIIATLLRRPGGISHIAAHITSASLGVMTMMNMFYGLTSNRTYEEQSGPTKTYTF